MRFIDKDTLLMLLAFFIGLLIMAGAIYFRSGLF